MTDKRHGAHAAGAPRALKPIHETILLGVRLQQGNTGCTAADIADFLRVGRKEMSRIALAKQLTYLVQRGELRRVAVGRYALRPPVADAPGSSPSSAAASMPPAAITPPSEAQKMAGNARRARRTFPLERPLWPEDRPRYARQQ